MTREALLAIVAGLVLVAPLVGAGSPEVVLATLAAALVGLRVTAAAHRATPLPARAAGADGGAAPQPRRRDRASDPVHHPDAPRAPGLR